MTRWRLGLLGLLGTVALGAACGPSSGDDRDAGSGGAGTDGATDSASGGASGPGLGGLGGSFGDAAKPGDDLSGTGVDDSGLGRAGFRFGINLGHPNPDFSDAVMSDLSSEVGVSSIRIKYPDYHFFNWGTEIEVGDAQHYAANGQRDHVAFVIGMRQEYSTAPAGSSDWERDAYIPKNLYEPIWSSPGEVNPNNYFAAYLRDTFGTYRNWVKYWEIWNEPDWIEDWTISERWATEAPTKEELVRFHGSIFDYVRMLRIASEVRDEFAPGTFVMTGGIGYPTFLDAIVRYTDNPDGGQVTAEYPETGGAYFELVSFHHYPHLVAEGASDAGLDSFIGHRDDLEDVLDSRGIEGKGYMVTENGASHRAIANTASGPDYAVNYALKAFTWAKAAGFFGIDWFPLSDGDDASDAFANMGLYEDISTLAEPTLAMNTVTGQAYAWLSGHLRNARWDEGRTEALELGSDARGYAFLGADGAPLWVLWADSQSGEDSSAEVSIPSSAALVVHHWDPLAAAHPCEFSEGACSIQLESAPVIVRVP
jgi:hypothetical protein